MQARRLFDEGDEGTFNHDYTREFVTVSRPFGRAKEYTAALTGEWWTADGDDIGAAGFAVDWKPGGRWRASAGVDYSLYRTDLYTASERYDSYGAYVRATFRPNDRTEWAGSIRLETDDYDTYLTIAVAYRWEF